MKIFAYWIVLYPSVEQCVSYALTSIVLANTFESLVFGGSTSLSRLQRSVHRLLWTIIRLIPPIFVSNLVAEVKYLSLVLFWLMYFIPGLLQYKSRRRWFAEIQKITTAISLVQEEDVSESTALLSSRMHLVHDTAYSGWYSHPVAVAVFEFFALIALSLTVVGLAMPHSLY